MIKKTALLTLLSSLCLCHLNLFSEAKQTAEKMPPPSLKDCDYTLHSQFANLRHMEANGVGYNTGYTTLEGFFTPPKSMSNRLMPFLDLRGHILNDGKTAANAGLGLRYLHSMIWGLNAYYDYRLTKRNPYHQVSGGFESLGTKWSFRANAYFPLAKKASPYFNKHKKIRFFEEDGFLVETKKIRKKREDVLKRVDAEASYNFPECCRFSSTIGAGPYVLYGEKNAWGGRLYLDFLIEKYVTLYGETSYDHLFGWIVEGRFGFRIPFGPKLKRFTPESKPPIGSSAQRLWCRMMYPVQRAEIIPVSKEVKREFKRTETPIVLIPQ